MFALSLLVPVSGTWHYLLIGFAGFCAALLLIGFFFPGRDKIDLQFGQTFRKRRGWTVTRWAMTGSVHAASASVAGTIPAPTGGFQDEMEYATFVYLPVSNCHDSVAAEDVEAVFTFESITGTVIHGPWSARWMNAKNPGRQHPLTNPESYRRIRIPAGSDEPLDLVYFGGPGRCYIYTDESARSGIRFDPATEIKDSSFRIRVKVHAPHATPLKGIFLAEWKGRELVVRREA